jgi:hypothetical protein
MVGTLGEHSSDPVPELEGNETPRQGIGNQDQGHPSAHGAFNSQFVLCICSYKARMLKVTTTTKKEFMEVR